MRPPGTYSSYSNYATALAGHVVARAGGEHPLRVELGLRSLAPPALDEAPGAVPEHVRGGIGHPFQHPAGHADAIHPEL